MAGESMDEGNIGGQCRGGPLDGLSFVLPSGINGAIVIMCVGDTWHRYELAAESLPGVLRYQGVMGQR